MKRAQSPEAETRSLANAIAEGVFSLGRSPRGGWPSFSPRSQRPEGAAAAPTSTDEGILEEDGSPERGPRPRRALSALSAVGAPPLRDLFPIGRLASALRLLRKPSPETFFSRLGDSQLGNTTPDMSQGELLTTAQAAGEYREVEKLDDGKIRALTSSLLVAPIMRNVSSAISRGEDDVYDSLSGDVVVLGGYRGSVLRDSVTGRRAWIPVLKAGLNLKKINLVLGVGDEAEEMSRDTLFPDGMLSHVGPVDISRRLMRKLAANGDVVVHNWGYDWRLSLDLTAQALHEFIARLYATNGGRPVILIGHSMGGLVAHGAMAKDPKMVRGVVYAGTPLPCGNVLGPMRFSDQILLAKDLLTNEANFMMRSSFVFVPPKEVGMFRDASTGEFIREDDGALLDYWRPQTWVRWNGNPLVAGVRWRMDHAHVLETVQAELAADSGSSQSPPLDGDYAHSRSRARSHRSQSPDLLHHLHQGSGLHESSDPPQPLFANLSSYKGSNPRIQRTLRLLRTTLPQGLALEDVLPPHGVDPETERIVAQQIRTGKLSVSFNDAYAYLARTLARTRAFIESLKRDAAKSYPPLVQIYSRSTPSVKFCIVDGPEAVRRGEYYNFFYAEGDGVGYAGWLFPRADTTKPKTTPPNGSTPTQGYAPEELQGFGYDAAWGYPLAARVQSQASHIALLTDLDAMGEALEAILQAEAM